MIDESLATRIPEGWKPPAPMVERVRILERFLVVRLVADADADLARAQAEQARVYALAARTAVAEDEREGTLEQEWALRSWKAEIAAVTNSSRQAVAGIMGRSAVLTEDFPLVHAALAAGEVSMAHARIVCAAGAIVVHDDPAEQAARRELFVQVVLEKARSTSPGRLKDFAIKQAERLTASSLEQRYEQAMKSRAVLVTREQDGMGSLGVRHSLPVLTAIDGRLSEMAKAIISARGDDSDDPRTFHQVQADVFAELLLTGELTSCPQAAGIVAKASVAIPVLTMLADGGAAGGGAGAAIDTTPALLDGVTPIPMSLARELAAAAPVFERILTHPSRERWSRLTATGRRRPCAPGCGRGTCTAVSRAAGSPPRTATSTTRSRHRKVGRRASSTSPISAAGTTRSRATPGGRCDSSPAVSSSGFHPRALPSSTAPNREV